MTVISVVDNFAFQPPSRLKCALIRPRPFQSSREMWKTIAQFITLFTRCLNT